MATIEAAFADVPPEQLQATAGALTEALSHVSAIENKVMNEVGATSAADFGPVIRQLREASRLVQEQLRRRGLAADGAAVNDSGESQAAEMPVGGTIASVGSVPGEIRSRQDVIAALGRIREYYERNEPSSPLPLLMMRAERLVNKSFIEILTDFAPEGVAQAKLIGGVKDDADNST
jgi:type VI secretion system protein ImpA